MTTPPDTPTDAATRARRREGPKKYDDPSAEMRAALVERLTYAGLPTTAERVRDEDSTMIPSWVAFDLAADREEAAFRRGVEASAEVAEKRASMLDGGKLTSWTVTRARIDAYRTAAAAIRTLTPESRR